MRKKSPADLEVFGARVLVRRYQDDEIGGGLLVVPEYTKQTSSRGLVVARGKDCSDLNIGDDIIFGRYAPFELPSKQHDDLRDMPELLIMNEEDVLLRIAE